MKSEQINELAAALSKAQAEMEPATFDKVNPHFKSRFASLAACVKTAKGPLSKYGLSVVQLPERKDDGSLVLVTTLMHTSGQWINGEIPVSGNTPQQIGSSLSYARRYSFSSAIGLVSEEDDDGEAASRPPKRNSHVPEVGSAPQGAIPPAPENEAGGGPSSNGSHATTPPRMPTEKQLKRLFAISRANGWNNDAVKAYMRANFQKESSKELTWVEYDKLCQTIERNPVVEKEPLATEFAPPPDERMPFERE